MRLAVIFGMICLELGSGPCAQASVLYSNTSLTGPIIGIGSSGLFDDVLIPSSLDPKNYAIALTRVTVAVNPPVGTSVLDLWWTRANDDTTPGDTPVLVASSLITASDSLPTLIRFGDGVTPVAIVGVNSTAVTGFQLMYLGLTGSASWLYASGPSTHLSTAYVRSTPPPAPGAYFPILPSQVPFDDISFYLDVQGFPIPEPSSVTLMDIGVVCFLFGAAGRRGSKLPAGGGTGGRASLLGGLWRNLASNLSCGALLRDAVGTPRRNSQLLSNESTLGGRRGYQ